MKTSRNIGKYLVTVAVMLAIVSTVNGRIIYVDDDAVGTNDGSSWVDAYWYLQDALTEAAIHATPVTIKIAQGTYRPDLATANPIGTGDRNATFQLINSMIVNGGYAGIAGVDPDARDVIAYETILSGDLNHNDAVGFDPNTMATEPTRSDNSYHIVNAMETDASAVLDGFTITGGNADGTAPDSVADKGGGMLVYDGNPTLTNCTFSINSAYSENPGGGRGGGVYVEGGNPTLINCTFNVNAANGIYGGGLYIHSGSPTLTDCMFSENLAGRSGGGIYNGGNPMLNDCTFVGNSAGEAGGGMANEGGNPVISNCIFLDNQAGWSGGGTFCQSSGIKFSGCTFKGNTASHGGGLYYLSAQDAVVEDSLFAMNQCTYEGGALALDGGNAQISACKFQENVASWSGGAIFVHPAEEKSHTITHCEFVANTALAEGTNQGGGAVMDRGNETAVSHCIFQGNRSFGNPESGLGGAVYCDGAATTLTNCTFVGNFANAGHALACDVYTVPGDAIVSNCILWDGVQEIWIGPDSIVRTSYSNIQFTDGEIYPGLDNINTDPNFALPGYWSDPNDTDLLLDPGNADDVWIAGDYHLMSVEGRWDPVSQSWVQDEYASLCIDAGDPNSPWDDEPAPNGGRINLGVYGGTQEASMTSKNLRPDPRNAHNPVPLDGAEIMAPNVTLTWTASPGAALHGVYFGDNLADVNDGTGGTFYGDQTSTDFVVGLPGFANPDGLVPSVTYYWRIVEVGTDGTVMGNGQVWRFTVLGSLEETVEYQVSAKEDDGYAFNKNFQNTDGDYLKIGSSSFAQLPYHTSGMVFRNVNIPHGAEIISARLKIRSYNNRLTDVVYGKIQAEATDNAAGFGDFRSIGTLPKTNASVDWDLNKPWSADTWYTSPDIAGVIKEIIDRSGWSVDNSLAVFYSTRLREGGYRNISSFDRGSDFTPTLEITYIP